MIKILDIIKYKRLSKPKNWYESLTYKVRTIEIKTPQQVREEKLKKLIR